MKKVIYFLLTIFISCSTNKEVYDVVRTQNKKTVAPSGTVWLKDKLFIDVCEITNADYREFIHNYEIRYGFKSKELQRIIPTNIKKHYYTYIAKESIVLSDSTKLSTEKDHLIHYLYHPAYHDYPVTNISYEQALEYCKFRTWAVNLQLYLNSHHIKYSPDSSYRFPTKMCYRLPSKAEWEYAASSGLEITKYPLGYEKYLDNKNQAKFYSKEWLNLVEGNSSGSVLTNRVGFGRANKFGLYNMVGNVSEMTNEQGVAKGLNYTMYIEGYNISLDIPYKESADWLGFRCICELVLE